MRPTNLVRSLGLLFCIPRVLIGLPPGHASDRMSSIVPLQQSFPRRSWTSQQMHSSRVWPDWQHLPRLSIVRRVCLPAPPALGLRLCFPRLNCSTRLLLVRRRVFILAAAVAELWLAFPGHLARTKGEEARRGRQGGPARLFRVNLKTDAHRETRRTAHVPVSSARH